jgi:hypothetical protein
MIHDNWLPVGKALGPMFLLLGEFLAPWQTTQCAFNKGFFEKKNVKVPISVYCLQFYVHFETRESIRRKVDHGGQIVHLGPENPLNER